MLIGEIGDRPADRILVGDVENESLFALKKHMTIMPEMGNLPFTVCTDGDTKQYLFLCKEISGQKRIT